MESFNTSLNFLLSNKLPNVIYAQIPVLGIKILILVNASSEFIYLLVLSLPHSYFEENFYNPFIQQCVCLKNYKTFSFNLFNMFHMVKKKQW